MLTSQRYDALNDRIINVFMKGDIVMSAVTGNDNDSNHNSKEGDAEVHDSFDSETGAEFFVVGENKPISWSIFPYLNNTIYVFVKYDTFKAISRLHYELHCLCLALFAGGCYDIKLQQLVLI